jgi:hypothetical protein
LCFSNMLDIHELVFDLSKPSFIFWWLENGYNHCNLGPSIHQVTQYPITMIGKSLSKNHFPAKRPSFLRNTLHTYRGKWCQKWQKLGRNCFFPKITSFGRFIHTPPRILLGGPNLTLTRPNLCLPNLT